MFSLVKIMNNIVTVINNIVSCLHSNGTIIISIIHYLNFTSQLQKQHWKQYDVLYVCAHVILFQCCFNFMCTEKNSKE